MSQIDWDEEPGKVGHPGPPQVRDGRLYSESALLEAPLEYSHDADGQADGVEVSIFRGPGVVSN